MSVVINGTTGITSPALALDTPLPATSGGVPAGTLIDFAGSTPPAGYLACDGTAVSRTTYNTLFIALGSGALWGVGDGSSTFNLPNFAAGDAAVQTAGTVGASTNGQMPAHQHAGGANYASNTSAGATGYYASASATNTANAGSGTKNLAAGKYVLKCIKY